MTDLRMLLATAPASGGKATFTVSALAMAIILTVTIIGAMMLAIATRRSATGGGGSRAHLWPDIGRTRKARERPTDAWSEAGRRMPLPPREEDRT